MIELYKIFMLHMIVI